MSWALPTWIAEYFVELPSKAHFQGLSEFNAIINETADYPHGSPLPALESHDMTRVAWILNSERPFQGARSSLTGTSVAFIC